MIMAYLLALLGFSLLKFYSYDNLFSLSLSQFFVTGEKNELAYLTIYSSVLFVRPVCVLEKLSSAAKGGQSKIVKDEFDKHL